MRLEIMEQAGSIARGGDIKDEILHFPFDVQED